MQLDVDVYMVSLVEYVTLLVNDSPFTHSYTAKIDGLICQPRLKYMHCNKVELT